MAGENLVDYATRQITTHLGNPRWSHPSSWDYQGTYTLERYYELADGSSELKSQILAQLKSAYRVRIDRQRANPYGKNDEWLVNLARGTGFGQNDVGVSSALDALWIYQRLPATDPDRQDYRTYAANEIQWVWGRNPFGESWLVSNRAT